MNLVLYAPSIGTSQNVNPHLYSPNDLQEQADVKNPSFLLRIW